MFQYGPFTIKKKALQVQPYNTVGLALKSSNIIQLCITQYGITISMEAYERGSLASEELFLILCAGQQISKVSIISA
jgi:hypothetical protein